MDLITGAQLLKVRRCLDGAITLAGMTRLDWRRQTDSVQVAFIHARLFADYGSEVVFVDGLIDDHVKRDAFASPLGTKAYFNRRFHDCGFKSPRIVIFDTKATKKLGGRRNPGRHRLHFHGAFVLPLGWTRARLKRELGKVFGVARALGERQFHTAAPDWNQHHSFNGTQVSGPLGKLLYALAHAGTTYADLDLNEGKRSRHAPTSRRACNRMATGLARGIPSNFSAGVVFCDAASKRAGKEAFDAWMKEEKAQRGQPDRVMIAKRRKPQKRESA